nr:hypothetical protein [Tanacetum cinerariifolium]
MPENEPCPQCSSLCDSCDMASKVVPVCFKEKQISVDIDDQEEIASVLFGGLYVYDGNGVGGGTEVATGKEEFELQPSAREVCNKIDDSGCLESEVFWRWFRRGNDFKLYSELIGHGSHHFFDMTWVTFLGIKAPL